MLDSYVRPYIDPPLNVIARRLAQRGVSANALTGIGFFFSVCAFAALSAQSYVFAGAFILLCRLMDGLDGVVARQTSATDLGGFFDIVSDFVFYAGAVFFFAVGRPDMALAAAFLIFSFMASGSAFLAYAIIAAKNGVHHGRQGEKSFFYLEGLAEGTETIAALGLMCLFPDSFFWISAIFGGICWATTFGRVRQAVKNFRSRRQ